jgi:predicted transcriptional regulator
MSTLQEIRSAIALLAPQDRALLTAELLATEPEPNAEELKAALDRGLADVAAGRMRPISELREMIPGWIGKS